MNIIGDNPVEKRAELWKAALGEGPGETPGPAGRALLADLRKLWLTREEERGAPPAAAAADVGTSPLAGIDSGFMHV